MEGGMGERKKKIDWKIVRRSRRSFIAYLSISARLRIRTGTLLAGILFIRLVCVFSRKVEDCERVAQYARCVCSRSNNNKMIGRLSQEEESRKKEKQRKLQIRIGLLPLIVGYTWIEFLTNSDARRMQYTAPRALRSSSATTVVDDAHAVGRTLETTMRHLHLWSGQSCGRRGWSWLGNRTFTLIGLAVTSTTEFALQATIEQAVHRWNEMSLRHKIAVGTAPANEIIEPCVYIAKVLYVLRATRRIENIVARTTLNGFLTYYIFFECYRYRGYETQTS